MPSKSTKEKKAIKLKYHNGSTYDIKFNGCCHVEMPNEDNKILRVKSLKFPHIIYFDLECLLEKLNRLPNDYYKTSKNQ